MVRGRNTTARDLIKTSKYTVYKEGERYIIIIIWQIFQGMFPDPGLIQGQIDRHGGIMYKLERIINQPKFIRKLKERFIFQHGVKLFNSLPPHLRKVQTKDGKTLSKAAYKAQLDKYLRTIPDEPTCSGYQRGAGTNSIHAHGL